MIRGAILPLLMAGVVAPATVLADIPLEQRKQPLQIRPTDTPVEVDAYLDDLAWDDARRISLPYESWPAENIPARARTEALVTFDSDNLYVAFIAHDPEPGRIRAHLSDRDNIFEDDFVGVVLDTFNDERRGFEFFVNPLGVQGDLFIDDINGGEDASYDVIWDSAGRITDSGYIVEIAIPFRSLRFGSGQGEQVWGIEFARTYPRGERHQFRAYKADRNLACYLCEFQKFRGFAGVDPGNNIELTPTITTFRGDARPEYGQAYGDADDDVEPGLDFAWGITPNVVLNATLNPDFSHVEADSALLDVNNQFALFFPERRPFFLEGQDLFDDALGLVYTRNVADPDYGVKVTGKQGNHGFGSFVTDDDATNLIFPGSQGDEHESFDFASETTVARYRYDLGTNSALGGLVTRREGGTYRNAVWAVDALYRPGDSDKIIAEVAESRTQYPDHIAAEFEQPVGELRDQAWHLAYERSVREYYFNASHRDVGEDFRADLGFVPQVGYRRTAFGGGYRWHGEEDDGYRRLQINGDYNFTFDAAGNELEREAATWFGYTGRMQSYVEPALFRRRQFYDGVIYYQTVKQLLVEVKPTGALALGGLIKQGDAIDFDNSQPGTELQLEPWAQLRLGRHLAVNLDYRHQRFDVDAGRLFTADIVELRSTWQFSTRLFVRWIAQYQDVERDPALYVDEVDARSREWFNQVLFSYKVNPRTLFFAGYSNGLEGVNAHPLQQQSRNLFLKLSYAWQL